jgi:hypothetical protein
MSRAVSSVRDSPAVSEGQSLQAVDLDFFGAAPHRFEYAEPVGASPAAVFAAVSADPSTWSWFPGIEEGSYESGPAGVGTRRWVRIGGVKYRETILAWDEPHRWAYRVDETSVPLFGALAEDWVVEPADGGTSTLHWVFAFDPLPDTAAALVGARELIGTTFAGAVRGLDDRLR